MIDWQREDRHDAAERRASCLVEPNAEAARRSSLRAYKQEVTGSSPVPPTASSPLSERRTASRRSHTTPRTQPGGSTVAAAASGLAHARQRRIDRDPSAQTSRRPSRRAQIRTGAHAPAAWHIAIEATLLASAGVLCSDVQALRCAVAPQRRLMRSARRLVLPLALVLAVLSAAPCEATLKVKADSTGLLVEDKNNLDDNFSVEAATQGGNPVFLVTNRNAFDVFKFDRQGGCSQGAT